MRLLAVLLLSLLVSGCVTAPNAAHGDNDPAPACPGHWHFMIAVFLGNASLPFDNVSFLQPGATELHWDTGRLVHLHPHPTIPRCVPLAESLATLDLEIRTDTFIVGPAHGAYAGTYTINTTHPLVMRLQPHEGDWRNATAADLLAHTPSNGSRLLISHGNTTTAELMQQQAQVPPIPSRYRPTA